MLNKILFQGRLVADVEVKTTASDVAYTEFSVAWSEKYKDVETKCFLRCKAWRNTAEFLSKYFQKGSEVLIEGRMVTEQWEKDGQKQSRTICLVEKVNFCGSKGSGSAGGTETATPPKPGSDGFMQIPDGIEDGELPFN